MLVTEKVGPVWLVTQQGEKTPVDNVPAVLWQGQGGMLGVFLSPKYATDHSVYLTYAEPGDEPGTSGLALARARLAIGEGTASLEGLQVLWRDMPKGRGGQFGAADRVLARRPVPVPDGRRSPAHDARAGSEHGSRQDPAPDARRQARAGQSDGGQDGRGRACPLINPPRDTEVAKTAPVISTYTVEGPNLAPVGDLDAAVIGRPTVWRSRPTAGCGKSSTAREAATS